MMRTMTFSKRNRGTDRLPREKGQGKYLDFRICLVGGVIYDRTTERGYQKAAGEGLRI